MDHTLSPLYTQLTALAAKHGAQKLVLFGSRARGGPYRAQRYRLSRLRDAPRKPALLLGGYRGIGHPSQAGYRSYNRRVRAEIFRKY